MIAAFFQSVLSGFFPEVCVGCSALGADLCVDCTTDFHPICEGFCSVCGIPFLSDGQHPCGSCLAETPRYDLHRSLFVFTPAIRRLIHQLKYHAQFWVRPFLQKRFASLVHDFRECDVVIPVPLHAQRLQERGFNQSALLAESWSHVLGIPFYRDALYKIRETPQQAGLKKVDRLKNLRGAFQASPHSCLRDRTVLLVDDVHTTGATLEMAARALKVAGAKRVLATSVAMVI